MRSDYIGLDLATPRITDNYRGKHFQGAIGEKCSVVIH